jgi:hypothetical protein
MRAMSCAYPHQNSKDFLIDLFLETRQRDLAAKSTEDPFSRFLYCFLRVQNVMYSRVGVDELATQQPRMLELLKQWLSSIVDPLEEAKKMLFLF